MLTCTCTFCQLMELRTQHTEMESLLHSQLEAAEDRSGQLADQCDQLRQSAEQLCRKLEAKEREKTDLEISFTSLKEEVYTCSLFQMLHIIK